MYFKYFFLKQGNRIMGPFRFDNIQNMFATASVSMSDFISPDKYHWYPIGDFLVKPKDAREDAPLEIDPQLLEDRFASLREVNDADDGSPETAAMSDDDLKLTRAEQVATTLNLVFAPRKSLQLLLASSQAGYVSMRIVLATAFVTTGVFFLLSAAAVLFFLREKGLRATEIALGVALLVICALWCMAGFLHKNTPLPDKGKNAKIQFAQLLLTLTLLVFTVGMPLLAVQIGDSFQAADLISLSVAGGISCLSLLLLTISLGFGVFTCRKVTAGTTKRCLLWTLAFLLLPAVPTAAVVLLSLKNII